MLLEYIGKILAFLAYQLLLHDMFLPEYISFALEDTRPESGE